MTDWFGTGASVVVAVVGIYFASSYRRQVRITLAESRRQAYAQLWNVTGAAAPTRLHDVAGAKGPLSAAERHEMYVQMTNWYYADGHGMILAEGSHEIYLKAKFNLTCHTQELTPGGSALLQALGSELASQQPSQLFLRRSGSVTLGNGLSEEDLRGVLAIRQLSLLRTQMKSDLAIYGAPITKPSESDKSFLKDCHVPLYRQPWRKPLP